MNNTEYNPLQPVSFLRDVYIPEIEMADFSSDELTALEDIAGIPIQNFMTAATHVVGDVSTFIEGVVSGISRFTNNAMTSVSRETYHPLDVEEDFSLFMDRSLNQPMDALQRIYHTVSDIQGLMGFGIVGQAGALFLNTFERVLASDIYTRLERAVRGHADPIGLGVRDMYVLLASEFIEDDNGVPEVQMGGLRQLFMWFFGGQEDPPSLPKKGPVKPLYYSKRNSALSFYSKKPEPIFSKKNEISVFEPRDMDVYPLRYTYISVSESVLFIEVSRLFRDFYVNRNMFEHRVNEFLLDIAILVSTYTMFIRQANLIGDLSDTSDLHVCLERLCLGAETLKSISQDKDALKILGLSKFDTHKESSNMKDAMNCIRESVENCKSIAETILEQQEIWDLLPMANDSGLVLDNGKKDVLETLDKLNFILDHINVLQEMASVLDIQKISSTLKQFQYKLKLSGT